MDQITRINHVGLRVRELATARAFYEKLGFVFVEGPVGPEPVAVMEHPSGINLNLILNATEDRSVVNQLMDIPQKHTGYTHIALEVRDTAGHFGDKRVVVASADKLESLNRNVVHSAGCSEKTPRRHFNVCRSDRVRVLQLKIRIVQNQLVPRFHVDFVCLEYRIAADAYRAPTARDAPN